ncbi:MULTISPECIES: hypothetical protein [Cyanophyceae]|uniref:hypothetical protein n=1 Tax=Cyanophyceae TaxID=3028117 RepID=UPI001688FBA3|nr:MULTISPECIES: hypothetical protein [Cyanophyceae]MBD1915704.1 hypothetical protein [Phormidium sp. FACHB-77]MBD2029047.1 hypothetical protein [Phormidium sp. FACHB-322]MBD2052196.1 hypothetical protein [Leptolyngbya sp. FACHB-60]
MQTLKRIFNPNTLRQWIVVFLAGLVVLTTTACGTTQAAVPGNSSGSTNNPATADSEGMYPHKDTDMDTSGADAKADRMIRQAEQRIQENIDKPIPQRYGETAKDLGQAAKETAKDAGQTVKEAAKDVRQSAKEAAKNIGKSTQRAADNAGENARGMVNGAADTVDRLAPNQPNS